MENDFDWFKHRCRDQRLRKFTLKEIIKLFVLLTFRFVHRDWVLIQAYLDYQGVVAEICLNYPVSRDEVYRLLRNKIKKRFLQHFGHPN